jgi:DNA-binding transcriptional LysR family regulator
MQSVMQAVRDGNGIGWSLRAVIEDHLQEGSLETVLDRYVTELPPFYLYYPEQNRRLELLRLFIDFLTSNRDSHGAPSL